MTRRPSFSKKLSQSGFLTVSLCLLLPLWILTLSVLLETTLYAQNRLALWLRLDICSLQILQKHTELIQNLRTSNQRMQTLLLAIYAARNTKAIPVVGWAAALSEPVAIQLLYSSARLQDFALAKQTAVMSARIRCSPNAFSTEAAFCKFPMVFRLQRDPALYPDLVGALKLEPLLDFSVSCSSPASKHQNPPVSRLRLLSTPQLGYRYEL